MGLRDSTTHGASALVALHTTTTIADNLPMMLVPKLACCTPFDVIVTPQNHSGYRTGR